MATLYGGVRARVLQASSRLKAAHPTSGSASSCSAEVQTLYERIATDITSKRMPSNSVLKTFFKSCRTGQDVTLAFELLKRYRVLRCSAAHLYKNLPGRVSDWIISACLRAGAYDLGLKTLWKHNNYGLSPSLASAHRLLSHAKEEKNIAFMNDILKTMAKNALLPTTVTAEIALRVCKDKDDTPLLLKLHKFFVENGVKLTPALYDICISAAANYGNVEDVWQIQKWRESNDMAHTIASAFSCAKAFVLEGKPQEAADFLLSHCQDREKRGKYLTMMIRVWPLKLLSKQEENAKEEFLATLKNYMLSFAKALEAEGIDVPFNVVEEFATGK